MPALAFVHESAGGDSKSPAKDTETAAERSVDARTQQPAQVHADAEGIAVEPKRNAAAEVEFEIQIANGFVIDPRVVAVVPDQVRATGCYAGGGETTAVRGTAAGAAFGRRTAAEHAADDRLISPGCDVVGRYRETEIARVVFDAAIKLRVIAVGGKGPMEEPRVHDGVADAGVNERGEISEGVVEMVRLVPSNVADAEAFLLVTGRSCQVHGGAIIQGFVGIIPSQIREETSDTDARNRAGVIILRRSRAGHEIKRDAHVHSEVARKVISQRGTEIVDTSVTAVAAFKTRAQGPASGETLRVIFCRPGGGGIRSLRKQGRAESKK